MTQTDTTLRTELIETDFLIIGGGTAGCYAALNFCEQSNSRVLIIDKANIRRSGCLAAGINAINAYIVPGKTEQDYVDYARNDAHGIVRGDLLMTMAQKLNQIAHKLETLGLTILKDEDGNYAARGNRNIKINGENIKPILADAVSKQPQITVMNRINVFEYIVKDCRILGVYAVSIDEPVLYAISAKTVLCATGGASGLYRPNHPGLSRHKMWYPPFNTGAGYAMGIQAGAEMTTFEMRFIALRCKGTIAPVGTLAQGVGAKQINALGEIYEQKYGLTTSQRLHGTVTENRENRGPCSLHTIGITSEEDLDLQKAYLNMSPSQTLQWLESGETPQSKNVEIEGTEPYIVGGHTASGYWVSTNRETTIKGLFAAGDVAGGCPQKYVTGAFAEGEIAATSALLYIEDDIEPLNQGQILKKKHWLEQFLNQEKTNVTFDELEEKMQAVMDQYAGGIGCDYRFSIDSLCTAGEKIQNMLGQTENLSAMNMQELVYILEIRERLILCRSVITHLAARKETRWHSFAENIDYPNVDPEKEYYVNSILEDDELKILFRPLVWEGDIYEH